MSIENVWKEKVKDNLKVLTLPEYMDDRTYFAAEILLKEKLVKELKIIGPKDHIQKKIQELGVKLDNIIVIDPATHDKTKIYEETLLKLREKKGMTKEQAVKMTQNVSFYSALMLHLGDTDAVVSGAYHTSGDVIRAGIQVIGTQPGVKTVSGSFFMEGSNKDFGSNGTMIFGDCAVLPTPTPEQLADIATATAHTFRVLSGEEPLVALLSFSSKGSATHESVTMVQKAVEILKTRNVNFKFDGEIQFDAALIESIGKKKAPGSDVAGKANCFIFPNLSAGNIGYKIAERLGGMKAYGPIVQGLAKPYNDLSRGASINDIVITCVITLLQAQNH